jgi:hypothetical protein
MVYGLGVDRHNEISRSCSSPPQEYVLSTPRGDAVMQYLVTGMVVAGYRLVVVVGCEVSVRTQT